MSSMSVSGALALLKAIGTPGSIGFLAVCCLIGLVARFVWPRSTRGGRLWLLFVFSAYVVMATPVVANAIADGLPATGSRNTDSGPTGIDALIVLSGDN